MVLHLMAISGGYATTTAELRGSGSKVTAKSWVLEPKVVTQS